MHSVKLHYTMFPAVCDLIKPISSLSSGLTLELNSAIRFRHLCGYQVNDFPALFDSWS